MTERGVSSEGFRRGVGGGKGWADLMPCGVARGCGRKGHEEEERFM